MTEAEAAPPPPPPTLPCDPAPLFKFKNSPSQYANDNSNLRLILYNRIHPNQQDKVKNDTFDSLQTFHGANPLDSIKEIVETIDTMSYSQLLTSKKKLLNDFAAFLKQKIPNKSAGSIAGNWAPCIPKPVPQIESVINLVIRMANIAEDGNKVLYWLTNTLFPKFSQKKNCMMNSHIGAVCRCIVPPARKAYWALLDTEKNFKLYLLKKNNVVIDFTCKVKRTRVHEDGRSVVITDDKDVDVKTFLPVDINQAQMWGAALAKTHSPFPYFLSSFQTPLPPEYYHALYEAFTHNDMFIVRCVTNKTVTKPNDSEGLGHLLMDSLFDIFAHAARMPNLLNQMVALDLYGEVKAKDFLREATNFGNLVNIFVERFGKAYHTKFVSKLVDYISKKDVFASGLKASAKDVEIPLCSAMKLIYSSASLVPKELKHIAQVIFAYSACKFNFKQDVYTCVSNYFFFRCLISILKNPEVFGGEPASGNVKGFCEIASVAFSFGEFSSSLDGLNDRMQHNVYPKLEQFLFSISELTKPPSYESVAKERFVKIIENVLMCISRKSPSVKEDDAFIQFVQRFNEAAMINHPEATITPFNLHLVMSLFFQYRNDPDMIKLYESGQSLDAPQNYFSPPEPALAPVDPGLGSGFPAMPGGAPVGADPFAELNPIGATDPFATIGASAGAAGGKPAKKSGSTPPKKSATPAKKPDLPGKKPAPAAAGKKGAAPAAAKKPAAPAKKAAAPAKKAAAPAKKAAAPAKKAAAPAKKAAAPAKKPPAKKK